MPLSDIPVSSMVVIFLAIFVLVGIHPALKRTAVRIRKLLADKTRSGKPFASLHDDAYADAFKDHPNSEPLNDFEIIVLRRIAQAGGKALSRKQVNESLLFDDAVLAKTLRALNERRMIALRISKIFGQGFVLSEAGRRYALEQGYIVQIRA